MKNKTYNTNYQESIKAMQKIYIIFIVSCLPLFAFSQVGINTTDPEASLDINGNLRIQTVPVSLTTEDSNMVIDSLGHVKKSLVGRATLRAYLTQNYQPGSDDNAIYRIPYLDAFENPYNDFNTTTSIFTAPVTGYYNVRMTLTVRPTTDGTISKNNVVYGIAQSSGTSSTDSWVMRFSVPVTYIQGVKMTTNAGVSNSFFGIVKLFQGQKYYFATTNYVTILATSVGTTGSGIATYFEVQLVKTLAS